MDWSRAGTRPRVGKFNVLQEGKPQGEEQNWLLRERTFGKFSHNITLPEAVDEHLASEGDWPRTVPGRSLLLAALAAETAVALSAEAAVTWRAETAAVAGVRLSCPALLPT
jgi:hypothetical protein